MDLNYQCLRRFFIVFNSLFLVFGCLLSLLIIFGSLHLQGGWILMIFFLCVIGIFGLSCLTSGCTKNHTALKFASFMVPSQIVILFAGIIFAIIGLFRGILMEIGMDSRGWILIIFFSSANIIIGLSCLGVTSGYTKNNSTLKVFAGFMVTFLILTLLAVIFAIIGLNGPEGSSVAMFSLHSFFKVTMGVSFAVGMFTLYDFFKVMMGVSFGFAVAALVSLVISLLLLRLQRDQAPPSPHLNETLIESQTHNQIILTPVLSPF